jgi:hypothetical protein
MKNTLYLFIIGVVFLYMVRKGYDKLEEEGLEPDFKESIKRGFIETIESIKDFYSSIAPGSDDDEIEQGTRLPNSYMGNFTNQVSSFSGINHIKGGLFVMKDREKRLAKRKEREALDDIKIKGYTVN